MSAEIWHEGEMLGVLVAAVATGPTLDTPALHDDVHTAAVVARMDPMNTSAPDTQRIIVHPAYRAGAPAVAIDARLTARLDRTTSGSIARYHDPVGTTNPGGDTWIAGFARVPDTPFTVLVQRRHEDTLAEAQQALAATRWRWYTALAGLGLVVGLGGMALARRRAPLRPA
jgi:hypothetical protein